MKVVSIVGARPQFIKSAPLSRLLRQTATEVLVHTGQHYDDNMSAIFFEDLGIPAPDYNLEVGSGQHGAQTGLMLARIEEVLLAERPDWVLVYGDTNSTLAGALAAAKLHIKVAHVEAGLRSFNREMPEEHNRVLTDHCADLLFCPSQIAAANLSREGITRGVHVVGDVMAEALSYAVERARNRSKIITQMELKPKGYLLATVHRVGNTDNPSRLRNILAAFNALKEPIVFPVHPRTRKAIQTLGYPIANHIKLIEPVSYLDIVQLEQNARLILTDSGGIQKEAYWLGVPCVTLRDETEWVETVQTGWNVLAGSATECIVQTVCSFVFPSVRPTLYGDGQGAGRCVALLSDCQED